MVAAVGMFHTRLDDGNLPALRPAIDARNGQHYEGDWPPQMLQQCVTAHNPVGALYEAWDTILAVDYRPIFEAGRRVLMAPAQNAAWTESVKFVANRALAVARDAASARHDLMGRIFHRLVDTARYDGSYYTSRNGRGVCTPRNRAASTSSKCRRLIFDSKASHDSGRLRSASMSRATAMA